MNQSLLMKPDELRQLLRDPTLLVVDTRGRGEFDQGHIPGAVNLPSVDLFDPEAISSRILPPEEIAKRVSAAGIDNDRRIVFYDESGLVPSARVFWVLEHFGRTNMALLDGGFTVWKDRDFPVETGSPSPEDSSSVPERDDFRPVPRDPGALAHTDDVFEALEREDTVIIDTRSEDEYFGRTAAHVRNGHIPGAKHVDWQNHIVDLFNPTLRPPAELARLYEGAGVSPDKQVITYCRTASRSSHTYFVLRLLGYSKVRNYAGSWMEWCADFSLPVE